MPLTSDRVLAVIEAAERIVAGNARVERWALFEPPDLAQLAQRASHPDASVDDLRDALAASFSLYRGLTSRVRETLRPALADIATITAEGAHFRASARHNASARDSMRRTRMRRLSDAESVAEPGLFVPVRTPSKAEFQAKLATERVEDDPEFIKFQAKLNATHKPPEFAEAKRLEKVEEDPAYQAYMEQQQKEWTTRNATQAERSASLPPVTERIGEPPVKGDITRQVEIDDARAAYERERDARRAAEREAGVGIVPGRSIL